jgi:phosphopantetheinyl transferase
MPLVYQQNINETAKIGVWQIKENEQFFLEQVSAQKEISHPHKLLQHLAGRFILKTLDPDFPVELIKVSSSGKPYIENENFHFSISHCGNYAAAIISKSEHVGIDIENPDQRIEKIKNKFTSEKEFELLSSIDYSAAEKLTIIWSIKEAMFKWYGKGLIDFKKHLCIEGVQINNGTVISNCFFRKNNEVQIIAKSVMIEDNILSYVIKTS